MSLLPESVRKLLGCLTDPLVVVRDLDLFDVCAGQARLSRWALLGGLKSIALDRDYSPIMDINTDEGLSIALAFLLRVRPGGLCFIGAQCSSWVWLSRSTTKRSIENPYGNTSFNRVAEGNLLNCRVAVLCMIAITCGVFFVIEQPASSLFFSTAEMLHVLGRCAAVFRKFKMGDYGHPAQKDTILAGTAPWLKTFGSEVDFLGKRIIPRAAATDTFTGKAKDKGKANAKGKAQAKGKAKAHPKTPLAVHWVQNGLVKVRGKREYLKASQVYPAKFAATVVKAHFPKAFPDLASQSKLP